MKQVFQYLNSLPYKTSTAICQPSAYYLLNNYNPGYFGDGSVNTSEFTIPPTPQTTIADSLDNANIGWKYYGDGWNLYVRRPQFQQPVESVLQYLQLRAVHKLPS